MAALQSWFAQLEIEKLLLPLITACSALLCITLHEMCHGLMAYFLGDDTAKRAGRLSLNPLKHLDIFGLIMLLTVKFGWAKPVPIDLRRFRNPRAGMAITALAGPLGNIFLAWVAMMLYGVCVFYDQLTGSEIWYYAALFFYYTMYLSVGLAVFNLIPVPPLDGSKLLFSVLPPKWYMLLMRYERYGMVLLVVLLWSGVLDVPLDALRGALVWVLSRIGLWPYHLLYAVCF